MTDCVILRVVRVGCGMVDHRYYCGPVCASREPVSPAFTMADGPLHVLTGRHRCNACGATIANGSRLPITTSPMVAKEA